MYLIVLQLGDEGFKNDAVRELHVPAILEMLEIPYSGAGPNCLAFCYDKGLVNRTAAALGVPTPRETFILASQKEEQDRIQSIHQIIQTNVKFPAFIKPIKGDNSLGITTRSIVANEQELNNYLDELNSINIQDVIVQEYLQGNLKLILGTEYSVGVVGNLETGLTFLPILEVDYSKILNRNLPPILGFESKWDPKSPYWSEISFKRAVLSSKAQSELESHVKILFSRFGCLDYARFDFRSDLGTGDGDGGEIKLLEVNPNPGWCWDGKLNYMGKMIGKSYSELLGMIIKAAWQRNKSCK